MVKKYDIIMVDLDPTIGNEKGKYRPCLVVNNDLFNQKAKLSWVMPITSRDKRFPTDIPLLNLQKRVGGVIDTGQIKAIDLNSREHKVIDSLHQSLIPKIKRNLKGMLELD